MTNTLSLDRPTSIKGQWTVQETPRLQWEASNHIIWQTASRPGVRYLVSEWPYGTSTLTIYTILSFIRKAWNVYGKLMKVLIKTGINTQVTCLRKTSKDIFFAILFIFPKKERLRPCQISNAFLTLKLMFLAINLTIFLQFSRPDYNVRIVN